MASEPDATYASRMALPANHKPTPTSLNEGAASTHVRKGSQVPVSPVIGGSETSNSVIISAIPANSDNQAASVAAALGDMA